jgi:hypothetical protein
VGQVIDGRRLLIVVTLLAALAAVLVSPATAKGPKLDESTILVKFLKPGPDDADRVQQDGDQAIGETKTKVVIVKLKSGASVDEKLAEYRERDDVDYAEENSVVSAALEAPSDTLFGSPYDDVDRSRHLRDHDHRNQRLPRPHRGLHAHGRARRARLHDGRHADLVQPDPRPRDEHLLQADAHAEVRLHRRDHPLRDRYSAGHDGRVEGQPGQHHLHERGLRLLHAYRPLDGAGEASPRSPSPAPEAR